MLHDLDKTLRELLSRELKDVSDDQIHFATPDDTFAPSALPALNLFLYDIRENTDLRSNEWLEQRNGTTVIKQRAPRRVDCSYLITAWAGDPMSEHLLLGQVMQTLLRNRVIPATALQGSLAGQALPTSILQPGTLQSIGEFWQAMRTKPRAVLNYTVTISVDPFTPVEAPLVIEQVTRLRLLHETEPRDE